jgi:hypothetical protein
MFTNNVVALNQRSTLDFMLGNKAMRRTKKGPLTLQKDSGVAVTLELSADTPTVLSAVRGVHQHLRGRCCGLHPLRGRAMAQAVSRRPCTTEARVRSQVKFM